MAKILLHFLFDYILSAGNYFSNDVLSNDSLFFSKDVLDCEGVMLEKSSTRSHPA